MENVFLATLFPLLLLFVAIATAKIELDGNGYKGVVVSISGDIKEDGTLLSHLENILTEASASLFKATKNQVYFKEFFILVPDCWTVTNESAPDTVLESADVIVDIPDRSRGNTPYVKQYAQCGSPGLYMHLTPEYIVNDTVRQRYGAPGKVITHEWAHLRWGVFDEYPTAEDEQFYRYANRWFPVRCSEEVDGVLESLVKDEECIFDFQTGKPDENCSFVPNPKTKAVSSLMFGQNLNSVVEFCDNATHAPKHLRHNALAPNRQNQFCNYQSVWEVMRKHADFNMPNRSALPDTTDTRPQFHYVKGQRSKRVLVMDVSTSMRGRPLEILIQSASNFILNSVEIGSELGMVTFSTAASMLSDFVKITSVADREKLMNNLRFKALGKTSIGAGLKLALEMLKDSGKPHGGAIILITDGRENVPPYIQHVMSNITTQGVVVHVIAFGQQADLKIKEIASKTGGETIFYSQSPTSTALLDGLAATVSSKGGPMCSKNEFVSILTYAGKVNSSVPLEGKFHIDSTIGKETTLTFSYTAHITVVIIGPLGPYTAKYVTDYKTSTKILKIFLGSNLEVGLWRYRVVTTSVSSYITVNIQSLPRRMGIAVYKIHSWISEQVDIVYTTTKFFGVFVVVGHGRTPVVGAHVIAIIERVYAIHLRLVLIDNGIGCDLIKGDGIYSACVLPTDLTGNGRYNIKVKVLGTRGKTSVVVVDRHRYYRGTSTTFGGSFGARTSEAVENFQRVTTAGEFRVRGYQPISGKLPDVLPPGRITDFRVTVFEFINYKSTLIWTAVGGNLDRGLVFYYIIYISFELEIILTNITAAERVSQMYVLQGNLTAPTGPGCEEVFIIIVKYYMELWVHSHTLYLGVVAVDEMGNRGKLSNVVTISRANKLAVPKTQGNGGRDKDLSGGNKDRGGLNKDRGGGDKDRGGGDKDRGGLNKDRGGLKDRGGGDKDRGGGNKDRGGGDKDQGGGDKDRGGLNKDRGGLKDRGGGDKDRGGGDKDRGGGDKDQGGGDKDRGGGNKDRGGGDKDQGGGDKDQGGGDKDQGGGDKGHARSKPLTSGSVFSRIFIIIIICVSIIILVIIISIIVVIIKCVKGRIRVGHSGEIEEFHFRGRSTCIAIEDFHRVTAVGGIYAEGYNNYYHHHHHYHHNHHLHGSNGFGPNIPPHPYHESFTATTKGATTSTSVVQGEGAATSFGLGEVTATSCGGEDSTTTRCFGLKRCTGTCFGNGSGTGACFGNGSCFGNGLCFGTGSCFETGSCFGAVSCFGLKQCTTSCFGVETATATSLGLGQIAGVFVWRIIDCEVEVVGGTRQCMKEYWTEHCKEMTVVEMLLDTNAVAISEMELTEIISYLPDVTGKVVVDLGAGIGRFTSYFAQRAAKVVAFDFMAGFVEQNKLTNGHFENVEFHIADVTRLELLPVSTDFIFSNWLLMYMDDTEVMTFFKNVLSWLRPGGCLFLRESCYCSSGSIHRSKNPSHYRTPEVYQAMYSTTHIPCNKSHVFGFQLILSKSVDTYIQLKQNNNQRVWLLQKTAMDSSKNHGYSSFQEFLDSQQYARKSILLYEKIFDYTFVSPGGEKTTEEFVSLLNLQPGQQVLDVGGGLGGSAFYMAKNFKVFVVSMDLSTNITQLARQRAEEVGCGPDKVAFEIADATKREFELDSLDVIYSRDVLVHIEDKLSLFEKFFKFLKPGGKVLITTYCRSSEDYSVEFGSYVKQRGYHLLTVEQYDELLKKAGFIVVKAEDRSSQLEDILHSEVHKMEAMKEEIIKEFGENDFHHVSEGWEDKMRRTAKGEQRWGLFVCEKPQNKEER